MKPRRLPLHRKLIYTAIVFGGFFGFLEGGLRLLGIGNPPLLGKLQFGYDTGIPIYDTDGIQREGEVFQQVPLFEPHHELFWRPIANTPFTGPHGFRQPEPQWQVDSDDALTIVVLGDSCSFLGEATYPARLAEIMKRKSRKSVRVYNASCPGYTSAQGVLRLKELQDLQPDIVIVYFGWNDHWRSLNGCTDRELIAQNQLARQSQQILRHFHFYWLVYSFAVTIPRPHASADAPVRVPPNEYEDNLRAMAAFGQTTKARTLFLTAPTAFEENSMPAWSLDFFRNFYRMTADEVLAIPKTHQLYNQRVRAVAQTSELCAAVDLENLLGHRKLLYRSDCIHLTEEGHQHVAEAITEFLEKEWSDLLK